MADLAVQANNIAFNLLKLQRASVVMEIGIATGNKDLIDSSRKIIDEALKFIDNYKQGEQDGKEATHNSSN